MQDTVRAMDGFTFGCDPELFIVDGNGRPVCAEGIIPGTKTEPYKVPKGAVQVDGMAAEFNIEPARSFEEFDDNIVTVIKSLKTFLPKDHSFKAVPSIVFDEETWNKAPDKAKDLGCTPDFDAWTGAINPPPEDEENPFMRTASGHLHIGWTNDVDLGSDTEHLNNCKDLVKQLDWYLGGWSVSVDADPTRRRLYGKAGACRFKPYGVEYRVLSNFWISQKAKRREVWNRMQMAIHGMSHTFLPDDARVVKYNYNEKLIERINTSVIDARIETAFKFPLKHLVIDFQYLEQPN